jgi:hypothetical protein
MKLSQLLSQRADLLRQVRLANVAYAYQTLGEFATRVTRAGLCGRVVLKPVNPEEDRYCVTLIALEASQSIIEEHFTDEDLALLADVIGFATGHPAHELTFDIEDLRGDFVAPLRTELERAGVQIGWNTSRVAEESSQP